ncbi:hypothetical protein ACUN0C_02875 [Faunimonas sp. B44]|uniref:hypothetical protein n=1 Tax=Faunimonas sp. B44 TaxID=3461493 RepID=UPI0040443AB9
MIVRKAIFAAAIMSGGLVASGAATSADAPPAGYYECYFYGSYGLENSSIIEMHVLEGSRYRALDEVGAFQVDPGSGVLRLTSGALTGRIAHLKASDGKAAIVFLRKENEVGGRPTIDISDTWCYFEPR